MAESRFIKATAFCGYDKADVDKRLETLYSMIYNLKNEIRENKQIIKKYEEGYSQEKAYENAIAVERAQITQLQVKNEQLSEKNKIRKDELNRKTEENNKLKEEIQVLKDELEELHLKQNALQNNDTEDLGIIFIEAKKSRDLIVNTAKQEAANCEANAKKFAESLIDETNKKIAELLENAEKKAADIVSEAEKKAAETNDVNETLKKSIIKDMDCLNTEITRIKSIMSAFSSDTAKFIANSTEAISSVQEYINKTSDTPQEKTGQQIEKQPAANAVENKNEKTEIKTQNNSAKSAQASEVNRQNTAETPKRQAVHVAPKSVSEKNTSQKDRGGINLDDLMKQASELEKV